MQLLLFDTDIEIICFSFSCASKKNYIIGPLQVSTYLVSQFLFSICFWV